MMNFKWFVFLHILVVIIAADSDSEYGYGYQKRCINILHSPLTLNETVNKPGAKAFRKQVLNERF